MREVNQQSTWQQTQRKKRVHWAILNLDDLPKTDGKFGRTVAQLRGLDHTAVVLGDVTSKQISEDYSI